MNQNGYYDYTEETRNEIKPLREKFHDFLCDINPQTMLKTWGWEVKAGTPAEDYILSNQSGDATKLKQEPNRYWNPKNKVYTGFNIFGTGDISDKGIWAMYEMINLKAIPGMAIGWTVNGNWLDYHKGRNSLDLKNTADVSGMYRLVFDVDKKDINLPLPEEFEVYGSRSDVPSKLFFEWYVKVSKDTEIFYNGRYVSGVISRIVSQFSWVVLTPGGFHAYIELSENQKEKMKDITPADFKEMMQKFMAVLGEAMMIDTHIQNMNTVLRLPGSIHRKHREEVEGYEGRYITTPYRVSINYSDTENVDGAILKRDSYVTRGRPFRIDASEISYADDKFFNDLMISINDTYESEEFRNLNFYNVGSKKQNYMSNYGDTLRVSEMEVYKAMAQHGLTRADIINNLPGRKIRFSTSSMNSLEVMDESGFYHRTSGYKFHPLTLPTATPRMQDMGGMFDFEISKNELVHTNYCGGYINDFSNDRPEGPVLNFLYMYFKVLDDKQTRGTIISRVQKYLTELCPEIDATKLGDWNEVESINKVVGRPDKYVIISDADTRLIAERQTASGKTIRSVDGMILFDRPVYPVKKLKIRKFGNVYNKSDLKVLTGEESLYDIRYVIERGGRQALMKKYASVREFNAEAVSIDGYPQFMGDDTSLRNFYACLEDATNKELPSYSEYGIPVQYGHVGSGYYLDPFTKQAFACLGDEVIAGDAPDYISGVDATATGIVDHTKQDANLREYIEWTKKMGEAHIRTKAFINAAGVASMNLKETMKPYGWTVSTNMSIYGPTQSGKSTLLQMIMSFLGYKFSNVDSDLNNRNTSGVRLLTLNGSTLDPFKSAATDYSILFVDEMTSKDYSNDFQFLKVQAVLREAVNGSVSRRGMPGGASLVRMMNTNIISFGETPYTDSSVKNRFVRTRMPLGTYYEDNREAFNYLMSHTCYKEVHEFWFGYLQKQTLLKQGLESAADALSSYFNGYKYCTPRRAQIEARGLFFARENKLIKDDEEYFGWIQKNFEEDNEFVKEGTTSAPGTLVRSVGSLIQYAAASKASITFSIHHHLGDDYERLFDMYVVELIPRMGDQWLNKIDEQMQAMTGVYDGLFVSRDVGDNVKIVAYSDERLEWKLGEDRKDVLEINSILFDEIKAMIDSNATRLYRKEDVEHTPKFIQQEILSMVENANV